jgi:hypothetical protein
MILPQSNAILLIINLMRIYGLDLVNPESSFGQSTYDK